MMSTPPYGTPSPSDHGGQYGQPDPAGPYDQADQYGQAGQHGQPSPAPGSAAPAEPAPSGPAPGTDLGSDLGAALSFSGNALLRNPVAFLVSGVVYTVLLIVVMTVTMIGSIFLVFSMSENLQYGGEPGFGDILLIILASLIVMVLSFLVSLLWQSGAAKAAGIVRDGGRPSLGQVFVGPGRVILTAIVVMALVLVGTLLLYIPGLIAAVATMYALPAAVRGASVGAALKESFTLVRANLGVSVVGYLVMMLASTIAGTIVIGILISIPFTVLFQTGLYERLNGRRLPEPARS